MEGPTKGKTSQARMWVGERNEKIDLLESGSRQMTMMLGNFITINCCKTSYNRQTNIEISRMTTMEIYIFTHVVLAGFKHSTALSFLPPKYNQKHACIIVCLT